MTDKDVTLFYADKLKQRIDEIVADCQRDSDYEECAMVFQTLLKTVASIK